MGELGALFNPGMRHELEERRAKAARREEEGNARDGDLRIDLESGVAVINAQGDDDPAGAADRSTTGSATSDGAESGPGGPGSAVPGASASAGAGSGAAASMPDGSDPSGSDAARAADEAPATEPAPLRPRGKRATTAARR